MYRIALLNMPFAGLHLPSIALTQLRSVVQTGFGDRVRCDVHYLNMDFAVFLGLEAYSQISTSVEANTHGLGDWIFREEGFPGQADNAAAYFQRHFASFGDEIEGLKQRVLGCRGRLAEFLEGVIDRYGLDRCDLVGLTSMFSQNAACIALARRIKRRRPDTVVVMGGANCETSMGEVLVRRVDALDFVFSGPSLASFSSFVGHLMRGEVDACHRLPGVLSRRKLRLAPIGSVREVGPELPIDQEVPLDYDDYFAALDEHFEPGAVDPFVLFETSRGCWWGERSHCTFCGLNGTTMNYRAMEPGQALRQFERLFGYAPRAKHLQSVDNILPREYLTSVLPELHPPAGVSLFYEVKADLKPSEMEILARARVTDIQPGIEALST
jgi:magnesium-protoporphyrin IX monomethyl ester (oxidative) cyclase